jgi:GTPase SAR1 family protein
MSQQRITITLVGPSQSGKDAIARALEGLDFSPAYSETIGISFIPLLGHNKNKVQVWITSGAERYRFITPSYLKDKDRVYLVLDAHDLLEANVERLEHLKNHWVKWVIENTPARTPIGLIINKLDLIEKNRTTLDLLEAKVDSLLNEDNDKARFLREILYCSAKTPNDPVIAQLKTNLLAMTNNRETEKKAVEKDVLPQGTSEQSPDTFHKFFFQPNTARNFFLFGMLGVIGIILLGALGGPLAPALYLGLLSTFEVITAVSMLVSLVLGLTLSVTQERPLSTELLEWATNHPLNIAVGILLFLATVALIVLAVFFPTILANVPLLFAAINFVSSGIAGAGFAGITATLMTTLSASLIGIVAITAWDVLCRIGNALYSAVKTNNKEELSPLEDSAKLDPTPLSIHEQDQGIINQPRFSFTPPTQQQTSQPESTPQTKLTNN